MTYMPESRTQAKKSVEPVYMESIALVDRITVLSKQHLEMLIDRLGGCGVQALAKRDEGRAHLLRQSHLYNLGLPSLLWGQRSASCGLSVRGTVDKEREHD